MAKVPFFQDLAARDLILVGCRLQHMKVLMHVATTSGEDEQVNFIMKQGERDDRMFIILEGMVRVTRADDGRRSVSTDEQQQQRSSSRGGQLSLGKLHKLDCFGELAVLLEESPGVPLRRLRSVTAITSVCLLYTLRYSDVSRLRALSPAIDAAVQRASDTVRANRAKSLKQVGSDSNSKGDGGGVDERLTRMEAILDRQSAQIGHLLSLAQHPNGNGSMK
jgi:CRP-like cAMP-binding protein